jgi:hypothetical protein
MKITKLVLPLVVFTGLSLNTQAEIPKLINYQGKLTTAEGTCVDTTFLMQFSIYSDNPGGDPLWTETQPSVRVKDGIFNVLLGSVDSILESVFTGDIRYLGVKVGDDPEMTPRKAMVSVGYAFRSEEADTAEYARAAPAMPDDDWDMSADDIYRLSGSVGIGEMPQDSCKLFVQSDSMVGDFAVYARGGMGLKAIATAWEGTGMSGEGGHAGVAGNGGYIGVLGQGFYGGWFDGHGYFSRNLGIGTPNPEHKLDVEGYVQAHGYYTGDIIFQRNNEKLWRMFEDEEGLYLENLRTGRIYRFLLQEVKTE